MQPVEAFCRALWRGEAATVAGLADTVDPDGADRWGNAPLLSAAQYGDAPLVALLLRRGAAVDQGRVQLTPLTVAARRNAHDIVDLLVAHAATASLATWIHLGDQERIARALAADPTAADTLDEARTPLLHHAAEALRPGPVTLLLDHGAPVAAGDANDETALHRVADLRQAPEQEAAAMARLLLDRGAPVDARNWDDVTPLHQAVRARNLAVATVLLERGADANARDRSRGSTPLRRAVSASGAGGTTGTAHLMLPLARLLLAHGADPDICDQRGVPVRDAARDLALRALLAAHPPKR